MASQSFQAVKRLQEAGAPLPLVLANPAWQALMDRIDSNISQRQASLESALSNLSSPDNSIRHADSNDVSESSSKRVRIDNSDLASRKQALLAKINKIEGDTGPTGASDDYESYRRQCWMQYYEWMEKQKKGAETTAREEVQDVAGAGSSEDEDDEIHNALLGLS
jgi:hypothetical protein